jgi:hypothetical protein
MACERCQARLDAPEEDRGVCDTAAVRRDLGDVFEVLSCTEDKYDSSTKWWTGTARCRSCGQQVEYEYRCGQQNYGRVFGAS